jgi:hypothetical protein
VTEEYVESEEFALYFAETIVDKKLWNVARIDAGIPCILDS